MLVFLRAGERTLGEGWDELRRYNCNRVKSFQLFKTAPRKQFATYEKGYLPFAIK